MMDQSDYEQEDRPARQQPPEVHREREIIVTGGRSSGASTAIVVIFALVVLGVVAFLAFTYFQRDGGGLPDEVDINIEVPAPQPPATGGGS